MSDQTVFVAGHTGMVGAAIVRALEADAKHKLILKSRKQLDLTSQSRVSAFFKQEQPAYVVIAAAKVGGILANNTYPANFIYENLMMECNLIHSAFKSGCKKLLFLGSSCIYPKLARQPMDESLLLDGVLEPTNEPYAIAKIAGIKLCESYNRQYGCDYRSLMPTNIYGRGDNFHAEDNHLIPGLMRRIHEAKSTGQSTVSVWGTGTPKREVLYVDDLAEACVHIMSLDKALIDAETKEMLSHINVGTGKDYTIKEFAENICEVVGFTGELVFDTSKPDGTPRKLLDVSRINKLGWQAKTDLRTGLEKTYTWFLDNIGNLKGW